MNSGYEFVDKRILSYFNNKDVPDRVQDTIKNTVVNKNTYSFSTYVKRVAIILIIPILFGTMCIIINSKKYNGEILPNNNAIISDNNILSNNTNADDETEIQHEYPIGIIVDYAIGTSPKELYEHSDLVIVGKYVKNNKCWVNDVHQIFTNDEFEVLEVLKGKYNSSKINLTYHGGIVPLNEYVSKLDETLKIKMGFSELTEDEIKNMTFEESRLKVYKDTEYVIFLSYAQEENCYFVLCDGYGMRELKDGNIYNLDTKTFDTKLRDLK